MKEKSPIRQIPKKNADGLYVYHVQCDSISPDGIVKSRQLTMDEPSLKTLMDKLDRWNRIGSDPNRTWKWKYYLI